MSTATDRIEKETLLRAPRERVWRAITDSQQFGVWFGAKFDQPFAAGKTTVGKIVPTSVDPEVAALQKPHEGRRLELQVDRIEPMRLFSFRWRPADDKGPTTLVVFELEEVAGGTMLKVSESGFDALPLEQRASAFTRNEGGWAHQLSNIEKYLAQPGQR